MISEAFKELILRVQPLESEVEQAEGHAQTIRRRLGDVFEVKKFEIVGSHARGTAIRRYSDVDYLVLLSRSEARWGDGQVLSTTVLKRVRDALAERFQRTEVRRDQQAIIVAFGDGQYAVDVVPAIFKAPAKDGWPIYEIPDGTGKWLETSVSRHDKYLSEANARSVGKLSRVVQLLKFWCAVRSVPLHSFYIELIIAAKDICAGPKSYARCLFDSFSFLHQIKCRDFRDPLDSNAVIRATSTEPQRDQARQSVGGALARALRAIPAELDEDYEEAWRLWSLIFGDQLPHGR